MCVVWAGLDEKGHVGSIDTFDPTDAVQSGKPGCILNCNKSLLDGNDEDDVDGGMRTIRFIRLMKPVRTNNGTFLRYDDYILLSSFLCFVQNRLNFVV